MSPMDNALHGKMKSALGDFQLLWMSKLNGRAA